MERKREIEETHVWDGLGSVGKDVRSGAPFLGVGRSFVAMRVGGV